MGDVVKMQVFLVHDARAPMDFKAFMEGYTQFYGGSQPKLPARTTVGVASLANPGFLVEIEVVAVKDPNKESEMFGNLAVTHCAAVFASRHRALIAAAPASLRAEALTPQQQLAFDIYKELVEIDTVTATGDTKQAADAMAARLRAARLCGSRRSGVLAGAAQGQSGRAAARQRRAQADPAAGAYRRGAGQARGLVVRSVQADREGRILLRARHQRRQAHGGGVRRQHDPLQAGRLQAGPRYHPGAGDRRGDSGRQRAGDSVAAEKPPRPDRRRIRAERGRRRRAEGRQGDPQQRADHREGRGELPARGEESRRPQFASGQGQCDLPSGRGAGAALQIQFSA